MVLGLSRWVYLAVLALGGVACGGGDDDDASGATNGVSSATMASYEGTYALTRLTENGAGCDTEGPAALVSAEHFVMVGASAFGTSYLELVSCGDTASCADVVESIRHPSAILAEFVLLLSIEADPDHLEGLSATNGYPDNGQCVSREYDAHALTRTGDGVRVETRYTPLPDAPAANGSCPSQAATLKAEATGVPCARLRVLEGTKTGPLPE